jgi:hypothetical protein
LPFIGGQMKLVHFSDSFYVNPENISEVFLQKANLPDSKEHPNPRLLERSKHENKAVIEYGWRIVVITKHGNEIRSNIFNIKSDAETELWRFMNECQ